MWSFSRFGATTITTKSVSQSADVCALRIENTPYNHPYCTKSARIAIIIIFIIITWSDCFNAKFYKFNLAQ